LNFDELIEKGLAERRMKKNVKTIVILNEKEALISFPKLDGEDDLTQSFYGNDKMFQKMRFFHIILVNYMKLRLCNMLKIQA